MSNDQDGYNKGGYIAFIGSMVFTIGFFVYISFVHKGVDLKEVDVPKAAPSEQAPASDGAPSSDQSPAEKNPSGAQREEAGSAGSAPNEMESWIATSTTVARGQEVFRTSCASCHGVSGEGDGPAARGMHPRDLVAGKWKNGGDSISLFMTISHGVPGTGMASYSYMPTGDRWALVHYIRSMTHNRIEDDPGRLMAEASRMN